MSKELQIETSQLNKAMIAFRAINNKPRRQILLLLHQNKRMTVTSVYHELNIEQSVASFHLAILRNEGIVTNQRDGKHSYYSVNYKMLEQIDRIVKQLLSFKVSPRA